MSVCYISINGDGAAEPVPSSSNNCAEAEEACGVEYSPSWPATFNSSTSDSEQSAISKEVSIHVVIIFKI